MSYSKLAIGAILLLTLFWPTPLPAQSGTIEDIRVLGLRRMHEQAFVHLLGLEVGESYDEKKIRNRFKAVWRQGLFEDVVFEVETAPQGGKALIVKVKERPILSSVSYEDNKVAQRTAIEDRLSERNIGGCPQANPCGLQLGKPLDLGQIFFAETAMRDLLAEKGYLNSEIEAEVRKVTETTRAVHFYITPGGKTRVKKIDFTGNTVFKDSKLKKQLQLTQETKWYWPWGSKNLYHPVKWDQDAGNVRQLYLNSGYLDVTVRAPIIEVERKKKDRKEASEQTDELSTAAPDAAEPDPAPPLPPADLTPEQQRKLAKQQRKAEQKRRKQEKKTKQVKRSIFLTVPVVEGPQYTLGEITVSGNDVMPEELLRAMIVLKPGEILRSNTVDAGVDRITRLYEDRGHLYANVLRRIQRHEGETVADVGLVIEEDRPHYVGRIEFVGNTSTRDAVLRREMLIREGDLFNRTALDLSQRKLNQLGYWQVIEEPVITPIEDESRIDITVAGQEMGRNEIQVGGGYSGVDGAFFNGVYSTRNFLGRGQIVSLALQIGGRSSRYQLSFQEPWLFNKPYTFGFSLFRRESDFGASLRSESTGFGVLVGKRLGRFSNINLGYNWQNVSSTTILTTLSPDPGVIPSITTATTVSSITPVYSFSTVNNPYRPSRGRNLNLSFQIAGGPLGGDTSFIKPVLTLTQYQRALGKSFLAVHFQTGLIRELGSGTLSSGSNIEGVPRFERFWLGGETLGPRVFETRTIAPLRYVELQDSVITDVIGDPRFLSPVDLVTSGGIPVLVEVGGDRMYLVQTEYVIPMNQQIELAAFLDFGDALFEDQSLGVDTLRASAGIEVRFHLPIFPVPLRLIYGWPVRKLERDRTSNFAFSIGRSF